MSSVMMVAGGGCVIVLHCMGSFEKSVFLPPINLNGTALMLFIALFEVQLCSTRITFMTEFQF